MGDTTEKLSDSEIDQLFKAGQQDGASYDKSLTAMMESLTIDTDYWVWGSEPIPDDVVAEIKERFLSGQYHISIPQELFLDILPKQPDLAAALVDAGLTLSSFERNQDGEYSFFFAGGESTKSYFMTYLHKLFEATSDGHSEGSSNDAHPFSHTQRKQEFETIAKLLSQEGIVFGEAEIVQFFEAYNGAAAEDYRVYFPWEAVYFENGLEFLEQNGILDPNFDPSEILDNTVFEERDPFHGRLEPFISEDPETSELPDFSDLDPVTEINHTVAVGEDWQDLILRYGFVVDAESYEEAVKIIAEANGLDASKPLEPFTEILIPVSNQYEITSTPGVFYRWLKLDGFTKADLARLNGVENFDDLGEKILSLSQGLKTVLSIMPLFHLMITTKSQQNYMLQKNTAII